MKNTQHRSRISRICLAAASAALVFMAVLALPIITAQPAQAQSLQNPTFQTLGEFKWTNGSTPQASLVQGANGDLYGTTADGGHSFGGLLFKIPTTGGMPAPLGCPYNPTGTAGEDPDCLLFGQYNEPNQTRILQAGLVLGSNGNFYGTTANGFNGDQVDGVVFSVTPGGTQTVLYTFCPGNTEGYICGNGEWPTAALVQGIGGSFYGTTFFGGANSAGIIFSVTPAGAFTQLYNFCSLSNCTDGGSPSAGLIQAPNGTFYGTTTAGGGANSDGTVFSFTLGGTLTTLYSFCSQTNCTDGAIPTAGLVLASNGNLYGTTQYGGNYYGGPSGFCPNSSGCGTIFEISPTGGTPTTLYSFCSLSNCTDGANPTAGLIQATDGNLYGTTTGGGVGSCGIYGDAGLTINGCGTIFEISPTGGTPNPLYSFCSPTTCGVSGSNPVAALVQDTNGVFYGTALSGGFTGPPAGTFGAGTVFSLDVGLGPFLETVPTSGGAGESVIILGTNLTGATGVAFNGTTAAFTVKSSSEITTKVPAGATSGLVTVTTSSGTLTSNQQFLIAGAALSPATTAFVEPFNETSPAKTFTLTNLSETLAITSITGAIAGANAANFSIAGGTCVGLSSLAAGSSCTYLVNFTPPSSPYLVPPGGNAYTAALSVTDTFGSQTATVKGTGISVELLPAKTTFTTEAVGTTSPAKTITLSNFTQSTLTGGALTGSTCTSSPSIITAIGGTNEADFSITGGTCAGTLNASSSCTYTVTFKPSVVGAETATLSLSYSVTAGGNSQCGTQTATLKGTGKP